MLGLVLGTKNIEVNKADFTLFLMITRENHKRASGDEASVCKGYTENFRNPIEEWPKGLSVSRARRKCQNRCFDTSYLHWEQRERPPARFRQRGDVSVV